MSETGDLISVDHIIIAVRDLAAAEAHYNLIFGRRPSWRGMHPGRGTGNVLYRLDNTYIELYAPLAEGPGADALNARLDKDGEGLFGIAVGVASAAGASAALRGRGLDVTQPVAGSGRDQISGAVREWNTFAIAAENLRGLSVLAIEHKSPVEWLPPAELDGAGAKAAVNAADHVVVMTSDAEACKKIFGEQLGIRLALDQSRPEWGVRQLFFRLGGVTLEIVQPLEAAKSPMTDSFAGLAWRVPDITSWRERALGGGADVSDIRQGRKAGTQVATLKNFTHGVPTLLIASEN